MSTIQKTSRSSNENEQNKINPEKLKLIELSKKARAIREKLIKKAKTPAEALSASSLTINAIIMNMYQKQTSQKDFRTYKEWKGAGFQVKKGEKSYRVWAAKRSAKTEIEVEEVKTQESTTIEKNYEFWPMCCLFHVGQVEQGTVLNTDEGEA